MRSRLKKSAIRQAPAFHSCVCQNCGTRWEEADWVHHPEQPSCHKCGSTTVAITCPRRVPLTKGPVENVCPVYAENLAGMFLFKGKVQKRILRLVGSARYTSAFEKSHIDADVLLDFSMFDEEGNYRRGP